ncbi:MAG: glycosyltransferase [Treponemataceae bacterium]|nr:glycosyltransferase [Treponemataceae bacterium]
MNITIICDILGIPNNGTTVATLNLIHFLIERGHNVKVVSNDFEKTNIPEENRVFLPTLSLGDWANNVIERNGISLAKPDSKILHDAIESADVVHIQLPFLIGQKAVRIAKHLNKTITASFHCQAENISSHFFNLSKNERLSKDIYKFFYFSLYKYCDCVHYPTKFIRDVFQKAVHKKTNDCIISNGVNQIFKDNNLNRENDKFTIVCSGRFSKEKAQHLLIKAVARSKHRDQIRICFAGSGPLLEKCRRLAERKKVDADFNLYARPALVELLNRANLYVHTAFIEIEAISCLEAICCGLVPVINKAHRSATKEFALDNANLFKENRYWDLRKKIDYFFENPQALAEYKQRYEKMTRQFDQQECMKMMEIMLCDAIDIHNKKNEEKAKKRQK